MKANEYIQFLKETEALLNRLQSLYEQWFLGFERLEPHVLRRDFERRLEMLRKSPPTKTALRFRIQSLSQRWITLRTHWAKVARQIEEGTYRRDIMRARRRVGTNAPVVPSTELTQVHQDVSHDDDFDGDTPIRGIHVRQLYEHYVKARKENSERIDNVTYETVATNVEKMKATLQQKYPDKKIDFEVAIKDGRVGLKPVVR